MADLDHGKIVDPGELKAGEVYLWRVDATKANGEVVEGELWSFAVAASASSE